MADSPDSPGVKFIPPLVYLAALAAGLLISWWWPVQFLPPPLAWIIGAVLIVCGLAGAASAIYCFRSRGTNVRPNRPATELVFAGPYKFTRNPMYLSLAAVYLGIAIAAQSLWAVLFLPIVMLIIRRGAIDREEAYLERRFGAGYLDYKSRVRRWL